MIAPERLCLAEDGKTVVAASDPRCRTLLVGKDCEIPDESARELGILDEQGAYRPPAPPDPAPRNRAR